MAARPELLAPAGDFESLKAAVENGADAVYLGGKQFNARLSAANFGEQELAGAIDFAHVRGVKVYVTVNTLLADQELEEAIRFLYFLYKTGADAVIIQDLGLARLAREVLPELILHASTQMTVHNVAAARLLAELGFKRIILARELSLENIISLKRESSVEIEVFIHGALCVCYSGQCLMSSLSGGRSGNRGRCAQPCRLPYQLVDKEGDPLSSFAKLGEYLLSPRELNLSKHLPDLIAAGVDGFKIEGRMKRPEYVATVVRIYRKLIDRAVGEEDYYVTGEESEQLAQIFNRGFTNGYLLGHQGKDMMSYSRPSNRGLLLGRVRSYDPRKNLAEVYLERSLGAGDGIEAWVLEGGRVGTEVDRIFLNGIWVDYAPSGSLVQLVIAGKLKPGDRVFKTHDDGLIKMARATFTSPKEVKKIPLKFFVWASPGTPLRIQVEDPHGRSAFAETVVPGEAAQKQPLTKEYLFQQLDRLGNTPFSLKELHCEIQGEVIIPVREINQARRLALARLEDQLAQAARRDSISEGDFQKRLFGAGRTFKKQNTGGMPTRLLLAAAVGDLSSVQQAVQSGADIIYLSSDGFRSKGQLKEKNILSALEFCKRQGVNFIFGTPRILQDDELKLFWKLLEKAASFPLDGVLVGNLGLLKLIQEKMGLDTYADFPLNVFNKQAAMLLAEMGVKRITLSPELTLKQVRDIAFHSPLPSEVLVQGAVPLMVSEYCMPGSLLGGLSREKKCSRPCGQKAYALKDRKGFIFPVELDRFCHMHIFNSQDLCMVEDVEAFKAAGVNVLRIEARKEDPAYVEKTVRAYRQAIDGKLARESKIAREVKKELVQLSRGGITTGHYYRGVV